MELVFKNNGSVAEFANFLKSFKNILSSLLIECDLNEGCFISKGFTNDHTIVRYSKISFENAGLELLNIRDNENVAYSQEEWNEKYSVRVKIGIFMILPKFIQVVEQYIDTDFKLNIVFDIFKNPAGDEFHAQYIKFKSRTNNMKVKDCNISEFEQVSDDLFFNRINIISNPMSFELSLDVIKNLSSISSVFMSNDKENVIKFYTKKDEDTGNWSLFAYDETNESYDYLLGFLTSGEGSENSVPIYRENFFKSINYKAKDNSIVLTIDNTMKQKLRVEAVDKTSYTVLSTVTTAQ